MDGPLYISIFLKKYRIASEIADLEIAARALMSLCGVRFIILIEERLRKKDYICFYFNLISSSFIMLTLKNNADK